MAKVPRLNNRELSDLCYAEMVRQSIDVAEAERFAGLVRGFNTRNLSDTYRRRASLNGINESGLDLTIGANQEGKAVIEAILAGIHKGKAGMQAVAEFQRKRKPEGPYATVEQAPDPEYDPTADFGGRGESADYRWNGRVYHPLRKY